MVASTFVNAPGLEQAERVKLACLVSRSRVNKKRTERIWATEAYCPFPEISFRPSYPSLTPVARARVRWLGQSE